MNSGRTIFIGDIHGCYDEFILLIKKLKIQSSDTIYIVWDMINKWPKSYQVLEFLYQNREQYHCIKGNHEVNFLNFHTQNYEHFHFIELQEKIDQNRYIDIVGYIKKLPLYIEIDNFLMIHGWLIPWKHIHEHEADEITRIREYNWKPWYNYYRWDKKIIYGHWAVQWLHIAHNTVWLDSGCVYGKELSAYILETDQIIQQQALKQYCKIPDLSMIESLQIKLNTTLECIYQNFGKITSIK